jgi:hypothetical protein
MLTHFLFLLLAGCPDPTTAADLGNPGPGGATPGGEAPGGGPPPEPGQFKLAQGAGVTISGTLSYSGSRAGQVRIDILRTAEDSPPMLLHVEKVDAIGTYAIQAPPNTGAVSLVAFVDSADDGPSTDDPAGLITIEIGDADLAEIDIQLSDEPDLGELTPGDAPPPPAGHATDDAAAEAPAIPPSEEAAVPEVPADADAAQDEVEAEPPATE